jgi:hypothetical protein
VALLYRAQSGESRQCGIARGLQRSAQMRKFLGPLVEPRTDRGQCLIRRARGFHDGPEIRRVEMARDETERFKRLQQRRQRGHDVIHHGLAHRKLPDGRQAFVQWNCGALSILARSVEASTTSKVTPSW